jgi:uncharacterized metal-binding protein YceD (DUF177 family)
LKVALRKIRQTPLDFELKSSEITFKGYLQYHSGKLILLKANLTGFIEKPCDICAEEFKLPVDEEVEFFISEGIYEDDGNVDLDVVESFDDTVDVSELFDAEIELIKSDYHSCESCKTR